jgi:hypothetical protein
MGTTASSVVEATSSTVNTTTKTVSSYIWGNMTEVSLPRKQNKKFILKRSLKFIYDESGEHYKLSPNKDWTTDKLIPEATNLQIFKIFRHGDGHVQIFASFDSNSGLYDVSNLFDAISPLQAKREYLYEINTPPPSIPKPQSIYDSNTLCGMPMKQVNNPGNLSYSKSV